MRTKRKTGTSDKSGANPARREPTDLPTEASARGRRKALWPVLFGLQLVLIGGGLLLLWPFLATWGTGFAAALVAVVLVLSLTPLLLINKIMRRPPSSFEEQEKEEAR